MPNQSRPQSRSTAINLYKRITMLGDYVFGKTFSKKKPLSSLSRILASSHCRLWKISKWIQIKQASKILFLLTLIIAIGSNQVSALLLDEPNVNEVNTELRRIYADSIQRSGQPRNPVILIPGMFGSSLVNDKREKIWGEFSLKTDFTQLALPIQADSIPDVVKFNRVEPSRRTSILGWNWEKDSYRQIMEALGTVDGGTPTSSQSFKHQDHQSQNSPKLSNNKNQNFDHFQFAYDWRRDNVENAQLLNKFILEKREYLRQEYKERWNIDPAEIKFDIVAHSMGGLLTRYFLLYGDRPLPDQGPLPEITWAGARYVDRVILLGPPNGGTLETLVQLTQGKFLNPPKPGSDPLMNLGSWLGKAGIGPGKPNTMVATWGTFPSLYQMLPRTRHQSVIEVSETKPPRQTAVNLFDLSLWERMQWGLLSPKSDPVLRYLLPDVADASARQAIARQHLSRCLKRAERFTQALDRPASPPNGLNLQLIAGEGFLTPAGVSVDPNGNLKMTRQGPGDGVVLVRNALLDEQIHKQQQPRIESPIAWSRISFYVQEHAKLVRDNSILNNLLFTLLEEPRVEGPK